MRKTKKEKESGSIAYQIITKKDLTGQATESNPVIRVAPVHQETVSTSTMSDEAAFGTTLTPTDIAAVLTSLGDYIARTLKNGNRLKVDHVGTFNVSLTCSWTDDEGKMHEHTLEDNITSGDKVRVKNIVFTPDAELLKEVRKAVCVSSGMKPYQGPTDEAIEAKFTEWFGTHPSITRKEVEWLFGCSRRYALNILKRLVDEGRLSAEGSVHTRYYKPV